MGKAYIVGAGPGDPELITVKALKCIQMADVILYDRLVNRDLLREAKRDCEIIFCGKQPTHHTMKQEIINDLLVQFTSQGKTVVRLKGGDPFVFGRGGEEAAALAENGLQFEVVPGITAGIAAPAYAGIPITHREYGNSFAVVTGHCSKGKPTDIDWESLGKAVDTIAIYMGIGNLSYICQQLISHGKTEHTPVAVIEQGTWVEQRTVTGTLSSIGDVVEKEGVQNPAMIVVGEVVRFREKLLSLQGKASVPDIVTSEEVMAM
ncbi:uroporphyrinogen-III C-methyltransferase [Bacillus sp. AFS076308]|uniref:uroporphyrinogen-III C-methyltransferase n=1 Tax=unclassified Bacillus (in: firmicutes) TaxID=185979 RepID=UPI000BF8CBFF|nr:MULTISPECIES: uroporphyrinogen-III C-methyltransferase [unclassified Bacillus (in: firmicutes)]PFN76445.1 uroporphyrinogen-III C-methyltransferase [Bacillus sp. AFS076308]PGV54840.1 uroporphyrinogen-III C-methyltransferase [Bacillus sp. AFS037270]